MSYHLSFCLGNQLAFWVTQTGTHVEMMEKSSRAMSSLHEWFGGIRESWCSPKHLKTRLPNCLFPNRLWTHNYDSFSCGHDAVALTFEFIQYPWLSCSSTTADHKERVHCFITTQAVEVFLKLILQFFSYIGRLLIWPGRATTLAKHFGGFTPLDLKCW